MMTRKTLTKLVLPFLCWVICILQTEGRHSIEKAIPERQLYTLSPRSALQDDTAEKSYDNFRDLIRQLYSENQKGKAPDGIDLLNYPKNYGKFALYYLLRDLDQANYQIQGRSPIEVGLRRATNELNQIIGAKSYELVLLKPTVFFDALEKLEKAHRGGRFSRYERVTGMFGLAKELVAHHGEKSINLGTLYETFGSAKGQAALRNLLNDPKVKMGWKKISFPYARLVKTAEYILDNLESSKGVVGMLRVSAWLASQGEETNVGHLYSAFGGRGKFKAVVEILLGKKTEVEDLGWEVINFPHSRLVRTAEYILDNLESSKGVVGMLRVAGWLASQGEKTHLGQLYSAFGGSGKFQAVVEALLGKKTGVEDLGWEKIEFPYPRLVQTAQYILDNLEKSKAVTGMLRVSAWLASQGEETNVEHLYSAFGGSGKFKAVVEVLLGKKTEVEDLWWKKITFPHSRLVQTAQYILDNLEKSKAVTGMFRVAAWLASQGEETNLGHLYSAFGGKGKFQAVVEILLGKKTEVEDLGWEEMNFPYPRLVKTAEYILANLERSKWVVGMLRVTKWLASQGEETNVGHLYSAFGGRGKFQAVVEILLGKKTEVEDLGWEKIEFPYPRLVQTAQYILDNLEKSKAVTGMLRVSAWLASQGEETNVGHLYSAFGGRGKFQAVVEILLGKKTEVEDLGWEKINFPYGRLVKTAEYILANLERSKGVVGMLRVTKWLASQGEETNPVNLYSTFGGKGKFQAIVEILLGKKTEVKDLGWEVINFPYPRLIRTAEYILANLERSKWVAGMLRVAKWLDSQGEETNLRQLYTAFGGKEKFQAVVEILLGKKIEVEDLGWNEIDFPYGRLVKTAEYILNHMEESQRAAGLFRVAAWLASQGEETHLRHLYSTFGGKGKFQAIVEVILGKKTEVEDLLWPYLDYPYAKFIESIKGLSSAEGDQLTAPERGVLNAVLLRGEYSADLFEQFDQMWPKLERLLEASFPPERPYEEAENNL